VWAGGGGRSPEQRQMWFPGFLTSNQVRFMPTFVVGKGRPSGKKGVRREEGVGEGGGRRE
jgi:hypothetical protein